MLSNRYALFRSPELFRLAPRRSKFRNPVARILTTSFASRVYDNSKQFFWLIYSICLTIVNP